MRVERKSMRRVNRHAVIYREILVYKNKYMFWTRGAVV